MRPIDADKFKERLLESPDDIVDLTLVLDRIDNEPTIEGQILHNLLTIQDIISYGPPTVNDWIPYPKKSPSESGYYYVTVIDCDIRRTTFAKYYKRQKRWELTGRRAYWKVIAWQVLPESYTGE